MGRTVGLEMTQKPETPSARHTKAPTETGKQRVNKTVRTVWSTIPNTPSAHPLSTGY